MWTLAAPRGARSLESEGELSRPVHRLGVDFTRQGVDFTRSHGISRYNKSTTYKTYPVDFSRTVLLKIKYLFLVPARVKSTETDG